MCVILLLSGFRGVGKDTLCRHIMDNTYEPLYKISPNILELLSAMDRHDVHQRSFAGPLKEEMATRLNVSLTQLERLKRADPSVRAEMILLANSLRRNDDFYFARRVHESIAHLPERALVIVTDFRFPCEASFLEDMGHSVHKLRLVRDVPVPHADERTEHMLDPENYTHDGFCDSLW